MVNLDINLRLTYHFSLDIYKVHSCVKLGLCGVLLLFLRYETLKYSKIKMNVLYFIVYVKLCQLKISSHNQLCIFNFWLSYPYLLRGVWRINLYRQIRIVSLKKLSWPSHDLSTYTKSQINIFLYLIFFLLSNPTTFIYFLYIILYRSEVFEWIF